MAELPTPHSIAVGTLISLYSDPNSPLVALDWHQSAASDGRGPRSREPRSASEWSLRLMGLIRRLAEEDEGAVVLPNGVVSEIVDERHGLAGRDVDPTPESDNIVLNNDRLFLRQGTHAMDRNEVLNDVLGLFVQSLPGRQETEMSTGGKRRGGPCYERNSCSGDSLHFRMEPLSSLLDRVDETFSQPRHVTEESPRRRTPPSLALLSRLQMASSSVDDLMNLLDAWHALLEGSHVGYPPPDRNGGNNHPPGSPIAIDGESAFGIYLRKLCLGMEEIPFEALARLWDALRAFVNEERASAAEMQTLGEDPEEGGHAHAVPASPGGSIYGNVVKGGKYLENVNIPNFDLWLPSAPQIERIVRKTCLEHNLDSLLRCNESSSPPESRTLNYSSSQHNNTLHNLLETHPECPSLHFLLFLSSLANGNRSSALESLHRYFDYAMIHERKERAERAVTLQAFGGGEDVGPAAAVGAVPPGAMAAVASGMGGITGGMTGGIINGAAIGGVGVHRGGAGATAGGGQPGKVLRESNVMQYAAVLLAQMYHRFGYTRLSLQATEEAVRVAQQGSDGECVCFANGWLALIGSSLGAGDVGRPSVNASIGGIIHRGISSGGSYRPLAPAPTVAIVGTMNSRGEEAILRRCKARASEHGLVSLAACASLELGRRMAHCRQRGGDDVGDGNRHCVPSSAWTSIQSAGRMPVAGTSSSAYGRRGQAAPMSGCDGVEQAPTDIYNLNRSEALAIQGRQNIAVSGLWESTGHSSLASLSSCAVLYGSGKNLGAGERMSMMQRMLSSFTSGPGIDVWTMKDKGKLGSNQCSSRLNDRGGSYAMILENHAMLAEGSDALEWISSVSSTLHEWSVRTFDLSVARGMRTMLANRAALPVGGAMAATEASLIYLMQSTHLFFQVREYDRAKAAARRACWLASKHGLFQHQGCNLLQLALIDLEASTSTSLGSQMPVERALPPLLECLHLCEEHSMDPLRAICLSTLARVFLCMGRFRKARALLRASMPLVMQHGQIWFQGESFLTLAKCYFAEASKELRNKHVPGFVGPSGKRKRSQQQKKIYKRDYVVLDLYETALSELQNAAIHFNQIDDVHRLRQVYYLQAHACNKLPQARKERDEAAKMFVKLTKEMQERVMDSTMSIQKEAEQTNKLHDSLWGVIVADS